MTLTRLLGSGPEGMAQSPGCPSARRIVGEDPTDPADCAVPSRNVAPDTEFDHLLTSLLGDQADDAAATALVPLAPTPATGAAAAAMWDGCHASPFQWPAGARVPSGSGETPCASPGEAAPPLAPSSLQAPTTRAPASAHPAQPAAAEPLVASSKQPPRRSSSSSPFPQPPQPAAGGGQAPPAHQRQSSSPPHQQAAWRPWQHNEHAVLQPSEAGAARFHATSCTTEPDGFGAAVASAGFAGRPPISTGLHAPSQHMPHAAGYWQQHTAGSPGQEADALSPRAAAAFPCRFRSDRGFATEPLARAVLPMSMSAVLPASFTSSRPRYHSPTDASAAEPSSAAPSDRSALDQAAPEQQAQQQGRTADTAGSACDRTGAAAAAAVTEAAGGFDRSISSCQLFSPPSATALSAWLPQPAAMPPAGRAPGLHSPPPAARGPPPPPPLAGMPPYGAPWGPRAAAAAAAHGHPPYPVSYYPHYQPYPPHHYRHLQPPQPPLAAFAGHGYLPYGLMPLRRASWHPCGAAHGLPAPAAEVGAAPAAAAATEAGGKRTGAWRAPAPPPAALWSPEHPQQHPAGAAAPPWDYGGDPWMYGAPYDASVLPYGPSYAAALPPASASAAYPPASACASPRRRPRAHSIDGLPQQRTADQAAAAAGTGAYGTAEDNTLSAPYTGAAEEQDSAKRRRLSGAGSPPTADSPAGSQQLDAPLASAAPSAASQPGPSSRAPAVQQQQPAAAAQFRAPAPAASSGAAPSQQHLLRQPSAAASAFAAAAHSAFAAVQGGLLPESLTHAIMDSFDLEAFAAQLDLHDFDLTAPASDFEAPAEPEGGAAGRAAAPREQQARADSAAAGSVPYGTKAAGGGAGAGCGPAVRGGAGAGGRMAAPRAVKAESVLAADAGWRLGAQPLTVAAPPPAAAAAAAAAVAAAAAAAAPTLRGRGCAPPAPAPASPPPAARKTPTRRAHGNISRLQRPLVQPASAGQLPGPIRVTVTTAGGLAARPPRAGAGADSDSDAEGGEVGGAGTVMGLFYAAAYIEGDKCIEYDGAMVSRSAFERAGGSIMAKWYRSIKVLPEGLSLGKWLTRNGLPILKGNPRCSRKGHARGSPRGGAAARTGAPSYGDDEE